MSPADGRIEIGATLRDARRRYGMEVREVEERTKIRAKYIRALENEDWETLPAPAYVRGFLRTYGQVLGLDGEMLVDEYRRRYGDAEAVAGSPPSESPLSARQRSGGERRFPRAAVIVAALAAIVVVLIVLGLLGGGDESSPERISTGGNGKQAKKAEKQIKKQSENKGGGLKPEDLSLRALTAVEVCLVAGSKTALIDNLLLQAGTKERFTGDKRYRLTLGPGSVKLVVGKNEKKLEVTEDASFEADSKGIRDIEYRGPGCP